MPQEKTPFAIKEVNADTFDDFFGLICKLAEYEKLTPPDEAAKKRLRADCLSDKPRFKAFVGKIGDKSVAYVIYFFTYSSFLALPTLFIEDIFVLKEFRQNGVGGKMFDECKRRAKEAGCGRIEFTVLDWNTTAQKFYQKNGAKHMSEWYFYRVAKENF